MDPHCPEGDSKHPRGKDEDTTLGPTGGESGALGEYKLLKKGGNILTLPSKCTIQIEEGDTLIIHTPGGGGYGDPKRRDTQMVLRDMLNGLVSSESAERDYSVSIRDGEVDENRTRLLRTES